MEAVREPEWRQVLDSAARLQQLVPDAVLVGGTAAAAHAGHRVSFDDDHVVRDLRERFDDVLDALETTDGWVSARTRRPVLIPEAWMAWRPVSASSSGAAHWRWRSSPPGKR